MPMLLISRSSLSLSTTTTSHSLTTITPLITSLGTIVSSTLVALRNELASLGIQCPATTARTRLSLVLRRVARLDILVATTASSSSAPSATGSRNTRTTLALGLLLLLLLWLLGLLLILLVTAATTTTTAASGNRKSGLKSSQDARAAGLITGCRWFVGQLCRLLVLNLPKGIRGICLRGCRCLPSLWLRLLGLLRRRVFLDLAL